MLAAAALLCGTLKFDGLLVLQARSAGAVPLLMVECSSAREVRGLARYGAHAKRSRVLAIWLHTYVHHGARAGTRRSTSRGSASGVTLLLLSPSASPERV